MECSLGKGELMRLSGGERGLALRCLRGTIWLTIGDGRDYLVKQGTSFELRESASALAEALGEAEVRLEVRPHEEKGMASIALRRRPIPLCG